MTSQPPYMPGGYAPPASTDTPAPPPATRSKLPLIIGALAAFVVLAGAIGIGAAWFFTTGGGSGLTEQVAQRECRTALEQEAKTRANRAGTDTVLVSVNGVELQETFRTGDGWTVNGTVSYSMTTVLVPQVTQELSLSCTATGDDDKVATAVSNR